MQKHLRKLQKPAEFAHDQRYHRSELMMAKHKDRQRLNRTRVFPRTTACLIVIGLCVVDVAAQMKHGGNALGVVNFPVSCSPQAQTAFNHAVALLHHMTYPQAREALQHVQMIDARSEERRVGKECRSRWS